MKIIFIALLLNSLIFSLDFDSMRASEEEAMKQKKSEFEQKKLDENNEFDTYSKSFEKEYKAYKKELAEYWKNPELSTKKDWVSYSEDKQSRSKVDFKNNEITIEVIAPSQEEAEGKITKRLSYVVSKDTKEVVNTDPLQRRVSQINKSKIDKPVLMDSKPILSNVLFDKKPTKKDIQSYTKKTVKKNKIKVRKSKFENKNVYKMTVALPKNSTLKRSQVYKDEIIKNANYFDIPVELVFAIMHTESNFNPFAKSHIPAFGLMQIVPHSAGRDVYKYLYNKDGMPTASYLYNSANNIEMGSTYLYILYYRYLKKIKNPQSRLYCTIAAYNTGAGNIAWAFTRRNNVSMAAYKINAMEPEEVYNHLLSNLRYDEPKHYLKRVRTRMGSYKKAYNL